MSLPYIAGRDFLTIMHNGVTHTVREGMPNYLSLREAVRNKDWDSVPDLLSPAKAVETFGAGRIKVVDGEVLMDGQPLHNAVTRRILEMVSDGFDAQPLTRFLEKLMSNPSRTAVSELYDWLERTSLPITEDGDFLAYKKVNDNYRDFYTGRVLNKPAELMNAEDHAYIQKAQGGVTVTIEDGVTVLSMPRNQVDDVRDRTCSYGLHFCSLTYLPSYHGGQGRVLIVKINPADVVSIPSDYDFAKGRTCRYLVIGEHKGSETREAFTTPVTTNSGEPTQGRRAAAQASGNSVMGVDFGSPARAAMVTQLLDNPNSNGARRSPEQGRMDGFDDAWDNRAPDLGRFSGSNTREALEYAREYFAGYDKCRGHGTPTVAPVAPVTVAPVSPKLDTGVNADDFEYEDESQRAEIVRLLNVPLGYRKHGYDKGYEDGDADAEDDGYNGADFSLARAEEGGKNYRRGYIEGYLRGYNG